MAEKDKGRAASDQVEVVGPEVNWYTFDGGGGKSYGSDIQVVGVAGQPDAGRMRGGTISLSGGYFTLPPETFIDLIFESGFEAADLPAANSLELDNPRK